MGRKERTKDSPLVKSQQDLVDAVMDPKNKGKSQTRIAKDLGRRQNSVSTSLVRPAVKDAIVAIRDEDRNRRVKIARTSQKGAERATAALERLVNVIIDKLEGGELLTQVEESQLFMLQERLFKTFAESKKLGLDVDEEEDVDDDMAVEMADETIQLCRLYADSPMNLVDYIEEQIHAMIVKDGAVSIPILVDIIQDKVTGDDTIDIEPIDE